MSNPLKETPKIIINEEGDTYLVEINFKQSTSYIEFLDFFEQLLDGDFVFVEDGEGLLISNDPRENKELH